MYRGFTLIETILYLAILAFFMGGGIAAAFYVIDSSEKNKSDINVEAEAHFLIRKIEWTLSSIDYSLPPVINEALLPDVLFIKKSDGTTIAIDAPSGRARISTNGSTPIEITNDRVNIENLIFEHIPAAGERPEAIKATFTINGRNYETTKYIRK